MRVGHVEGEHTSGGEYVAAPARLGERVGRLRTHRLHGSLSEGPRLAQSRRHGAAALALGERGTGETIVPVEDGGGQVRAGVEVDVPAVEVQHGCEYRRGVPWAPPLLVCAGRPALNAWMVGESESE